MSDLKALGQTIAEVLGEAAPYQAFAGQLNLAAKIEIMRVAQRIDPSEIPEPLLDLMIAILSTADYQQWLDQGI